MTSSTEDQLRDLFAAEAAAAPEPLGLADGARRKVRHRRRVHLAWTAVVVGVVLGMSAATATGLSQRSRHEATAAPSPSTGQAALPRAQATAGPAPQGAVPVGAAADCVEMYSPAALADTAFAFDGTVTGIGPASSRRAGAAFPLVGVTFHVNEWFRGGSSGTVTVDWYPPHQGNSNTDPSLASYGVGSRMLVSGGPRWSKAPLESPIAWTCGFTRYYDPQTAAEWAAALR